MGDAERGVDAGTGVLNGSAMLECGQRFAVIIGRALYLKVVREDVFMKSIGLWAMLHPHGANAEPRDRSDRGAVIDPARKCYIPQLAVEYNGHMCSYMQDIYILGRFQILYEAD